jgi:hypothetical protein
MLTLIDTFSIIIAENIGQMINAAAEEIGIMPT